MTTRVVPTDEAIRQMAKDQYQSDGTLEIDSEAVVSISEDQHGPQGAYVAAWVWVDFEEQEVAS